MLRGDGGFLRDPVAGRGHLQEKDAEFANRHGFSKHKPALPLYTRADAVAALKNLSPSLSTAPALCPAGPRSACAAGHILGAASVQLDGAARSSSSPAISAAMTARPCWIPRRSLKPTIWSSSRPMAIAAMIGAAPRRLCGQSSAARVARGGTVMIPAFAVGRAQTLLFHLYRLKASRPARRCPGLPRQPDGDRCQRDFLPSSWMTISSRDPSAGRPARSRTMCGASRNRKALTADPTPKVIISASGMATGGRVLHHLKRYAPDPANTILFAGFQAGGTRGAAMVAGAESVKIHGEYVRCARRCRISTCFRPMPMRTKSCGGSGEFRSRRPGRSSPMASQPHRTHCAGASRSELGWSCVVPESWPAGGACMTGKPKPANARWPIANRLKARRLGIDTQAEAVVFMRKDCPVCRSEGFTAHTRVVLRAGEPAGHRDAVSGRERNARS